MGGCRLGARLGTSGKIGRRGCWQSNRSRNGCGSKLQRACESRPHCVAREADLSEVDHFPGDLFVLSRICQQVMDLLSEFRRICADRENALDAA